MTALTDRLTRLQRGWFLDVNHLAAHTTWLHVPARLFAVYGVAVFAALLLVGWWRVGRRAGQERVVASLWAPLGVLLAVGLNQPLGHLVGEARPYAVLHHVLTLVPRTTDVSFPSDHAVMAGASAAGLLLVSRRLGLLCAALALVMAADRVYVGAHWPLDVVAGLAFGVVVSLLGYLLARHPMRAVVAAIGRTPAAVLVRAPS